MVYTIDWFPARNKAKLSLWFKLSSPFPHLSTKKKATLGLGSWFYLLEMPVSFKHVTWVLTFSFSYVCFHFNPLTDNLVENLLGDFEYEVQVPYLLYRNASQEVNGIWFYNPRECDDVANLFSRYNIFLVYIVIWARVHTSLACHRLCLCPLHTITLRF